MMKYDNVNYKLDTTWWILPFEAHYCSLAENYVVQDQEYVRYASNLDEYTANQIARALNMMGDYDSLLAEFLFHVDELKEYQSDFNNNILNIENKLKKIK